MRTQASAATPAKLCRSSAALLRGPASYAAIVRDDRSHGRGGRIRLGWHRCHWPAGSAAQLRRRVLALTAAGVDVAAVSGTDVEDVDRQLRARPAGPGRLWLCANQVRSCSRSRRPVHS